VASLIKGTKQFDSGRIRNKSGALIGIPCSRGQSPFHISRIHHGAFNHRVYSAFNMPTLLRLKFVDIWDTCKIHHRLFTYNLVFRRRESLAGLIIILWRGLGPAASPAVIFDDAKQPRRIRLISLTFKLRRN